MFKGMWRRWLLRRRKKEIRRLPRLLRGQARFSDLYPQYQMGFGSYGLPVVHDWKEGSTLCIGKFTSIAERVEIFLGGHHRSDWVTTYPFPAFVEECKHIDGYAFSRGDVEIGSDVWLCTNVQILSGVRIGHGAVVAAGSVVTRDVEPYSVVAGNPARHVRWRFDTTVCQRLLSVAWWDWPLEEICSISELLCNDDISAFLKYAEARSVVA